MEREKEILRYAYTQSSFYQSLLQKKKLSIEDLMEDWTKVPVVDRRQMICAEECVIPSPSLLPKTIRGFTSCLPVPMGCLWGYRGA